MHLGLGLLAGVLTVLSPCVLPILPLVLAPAAAASRWGLAALVGGLVLAFVGTGLFVATIGFAIGLDQGALRLGGAVLLGAMGAVLLSGALQRRVAVAGGGIMDAGNRLLARFSPAGAGGQFAVGLLLGLVWAPCVGPTLGAASVLAAEGRDLPSVAAVMAAFGIGAAMPPLLLGSLSRQMFLRWRGRLMAAGGVGKLALGGTALLLAVLILSGADHGLERLMVDASPAWLTDLTTRF